MIDWRVPEEERGWQEEAAAGQTAVSRTDWLRQRWRRWAVVALLLMLMVIAAVRVLDERAHAAASAARAEVRQTHALLWNAARDGDPDLALSLTDASNGRWHIVQEALLNNKLALDRAPLQLWYGEPALAPTRLLTPTVILSLDMDRAIVRVPQPYVTQTEDGTLAAITLWQTAVYRQHEGRWWLASAANDTDFWGRILVNRGGERVLLIYPDRDKVWGRLLLAELDAVVARMCELPDIDCPPGIVLRLFLNPDAASLARLARNPLHEPMRFFDGEDDQYRYQTELPAPTLVGTPQDAVGEGAMVRGYVGWVMTALLHNMQAGTTHAQVQAQLAQLGLSTPPVNGYRPSPLQAPSPLPLPSTPIVMQCQEGSAPPQVWQYRAEADAWTAVALQSAVIPSDSIFSEMGLPAALPPAQNFVEAIPLAQRPDSLRLLGVLPQPQEKRQWVLAEDGAGEDTFLFEVDDVAVTFEAQLQNRGERAVAALLGGDGRSLLRVRASRERTYVTIYNAGNGQERLYSVNGLPNGRWHLSPDGNWLLLVTERALRLIALPTAYERVLFHDRSGCETAVWRGD